ncbi:MAG: aspartyl protease family protein [Minicystis sp.]
MTAATCHAHPEVPAAASCRGCFRQLCDVCTINDDGFVPRCADCIRKQRRNGWIFRGVLGALLLGVLGAGVYFQRTYEKPYDYGASTGEVRKLSEQLDKEPCDRRKIIELGETMLRAGDGRGTLKRSEAFLQKCGDYPRLRWLTYEAHKQLSEWDQATAEATKLIESSPYDADYFGWRGIVYEQKGDLDHAAEDFRQAIVLKPRLGDLPINLANIYEKQGKPCDAVFPLEQVVYHHPDARNVGAIRARIDDLLAKGGCASMAGEGRAQIKVNPGESVLRVTARLGGKENGTFVIDTGASYVTITQSLADRIKADTNRAPKVMLQTANGARTGHIVVLETVEVQGVKAARVPAVVVDDLGGVDGLLGLSFLSRFDLKQEGGVLEISPRKKR